MTLMVKGMSLPDGDYLAKREKPERLKKLLTQMAITELGKKEA